MRHLLEKIKTELSRRAELEESRQKAATERSDFIFARLAQGLSQGYGNSIIAIEEAVCRDEVYQQHWARLALERFEQAARLRINGKAHEANCLYAEACRYWQLFEDETAVLVKPQPKSNGTYGAVEI